MNPGAAPAGAEASPWRLALQVFGVAGVAIVQPVLALLGENPTFFTAHDAGPAEVVLFGVAVVVVPALVLIVPVLVARAVSARAGLIAAAVAVGLLGSVVFVRLVGGADHVAASAFAATVALVTALVAMFFLRHRAVRLFALYLSPAPLAFLALFLFTSPVSGIVVDQDPAVLAAGDLTTPVVVVVFDELPLGALLRDDGTIDGARFPGFAALAAVSTWYPRATPVSPWTNLAIPAILTGTFPDQDKAPVAGQYPRSLFTLLGGSHDLHVHEEVTSLCPRGRCGEQEDEGVDDVSLVRDGAIVTVRESLPAAVADHFVAPIGASWRDFGRGADIPLPTDDAELAFEDWRDQRQHQPTDPAAFGDFIASIADTEPPGFWYFHEMLPHTPLQMLPTGQAYPGRHPAALSGDGEHWSADPAATVSATQRFLLQLGYVDRQVAELVDALTGNGMLDRVMLVVVSDHGIDFTPGGHRRGVFERIEGGRRALATDELEGRSADTVMPVPLFVKYPGQADGVVDDRHAEIIDIAPTVADALQVATPDDWVFDGAALPRAAPADLASGHWMNGVDPNAEVLYPVDPTRMARELHALIGADPGAHDLYAIGPAGHLVGEAVPADLGGPPLGSFTLVDPQAFDDVDPEGPAVPAIVTADVTGLAPGTWVAASANGTVAGLGRVHIADDGRTVVEIMLDPSLMVDGRNEIGLYVVGDDSTVAAPLAAG